MHDLTPQEISAEFFLELGFEGTIAWALQMNERFNVLADFTRSSIAEKYGQKTERFVSPGQISIFSGSVETSEIKLEAADIVDDAPSELAISNSTSSAKKRGHSRKQKPNLPRVPLYAPPLDATELPCSCCGKNRIPARQVLQNSRYQIIPATFYFEDLYSQVYECPSCDDKNRVVVRVPELAKNGLASPALAAQIVVSRDWDHMPFNRQVAMYQRSGVDINRSTLCDIYAQAAKIVRPVVKLMHKLLLLNDVIGTDDSPVKTLDRSKDKNIKIARAWAYIGGEKHPVNLIDYTQGRGRDGPLSFLAGYRGRLQGDCFSGNLAICAEIGTILAACIAHARRYFVKALLNNKAACEHALLVFQQLYEIERAAKELNLPPEEIALMRQQEAKPILEQFAKWLQVQYVGAHKKSSFGKSVFYCINNWTELTEYVNDGRLQIDNNHTEREMKIIAMGRKAWLFFGSDRGGKDHATMMSLMSTCRRHKIEPLAYLTDVIRRLVENPNENLEELLPYKWKCKYPKIVLTEIPGISGTPKAA